MMLSSSRLSSSSRHHTATTRASSTSFWRKTGKPIPGRPNPSSRPPSNSSTISSHPHQHHFVAPHHAASPLKSSTARFQDYESSVSDAWDIRDDEGDDPILMSIPHANTFTKIMLLPKLIIPQNDTALKTDEVQSSTHNKRVKIEKLLENSSINLDQLRKLAWSGLSPGIRNKIWRILCGYLPPNHSNRGEDVVSRKREEYQRYVEQYFLKREEQDASHQDTYLFLHEYLPEGRNSVCPDIDLGNDLTEQQRDIIEADSFWCLTKPGIQLKVKQLEELIKRIDAELHFSSSFLMKFKDEILRRKDFHTVLMFLQNLPTAKWGDEEIELIVAEAYQLSYLFADAPSHLRSHQIMERCASAACCQALTNRIKSPKCYYFFLLILTSSLMGSMMFSNTQSKLMSIFRDFNATCIDLELNDDDCQELTGYSALYKISCPVATFFLLLSGLSIRFPCIHQGFWFCKTVLLFLTILASFLIPITHFRELRDFWIYLTLTGNCIYVFLILYAIIDSLKRFLKCYRNILGEVFASIGVLIIWITSIVGLFILHGNKCFTMAMILSANSGLSLITLFAASFARMKVMNEGRLIESGIVSLYVAYWTWSCLAISPISEPEWMHFKFFSGNRTCGSTSHNLERTCLFVTAFMLMILTVFYFFHGTLDDSKSGVDMEHSHHHRSSNARIVILNPERSVERDKDSSQNSSFSLPAFYAVLSLALMFMTAQLTGWSVPDDIIHFGRKSWYAVGFKMIVAWVISGIYLTYLLVPSELFHFSNRASTISSTIFLRSPLLRRQGQDITGPQTSHI
ncbi:TBC1D22 [Lepeophtheirus salmonis]|uniref:TBC1D22 n=1 Tax=Lepeophtheirus salmonis TaxID=72036 RepID=A0A7R8CR88_LEPSM|nr:TBC1D22 [Lepeophtheirus salmonis]CAF2902959.1 TBC1D22 [Lepeophtheirus salmonis]